MKNRIALVKGDLAKMNVDAVVNAADETLVVGGGVDAAIHKAAGPRLLELTRSLGGCPVGKVKLTPGFDLPAKHVIHAVGPMWQGGGHHEAKFLANAYKSSLLIAQNEGFKTIAFPCLSTGIYKYPKEEAAEIAIGEVVKFLANDKSLQKVHFVVFTDEDHAIYARKLGERGLA